MSVHLIKARAVGSLDELNRVVDAVRRAGATAVMVETSDFSQRSAELYGSFPREIEPVSVLRRVAAQGVALLLLLSLVTLSACGINPLAPHRGAPSTSLRCVLTDSIPFDRDILVTRAFYSGARCDTIAASYPNNVSWQ